MSKTVKVGMVGTGFVGDLHHAAFKGWVRDAEVVAVASPSKRRNPTRSVNVVTKIEDATAGSAPSRSSILISARVS